MDFRKLVALALLCISWPALAQSPAAVSASNPQSVVQALEGAGYVAELTKDDSGDPMVITELLGRKTYLYFYGCHTESHDGCDSLQFSIGFDRAEPWDAKSALAVSEELRFASVRLDDDGDPYVRWDVVTVDGISTAVFLRSVLYFTQTIADVENLVFAVERAENRAEDQK